MNVRHVLICMLIVVLPFAADAAASSKKKQSGQEAAQARAELQAAVMRFSDHVASSLVEGFSEVEEQGPPTDVWLVVFADLLFATQAAYTIAVDPTPSSAVLDLVVLVSLGRIAYEEDRVPKYGEPVAPMGRAFQSLEPKVWAMADKLLTPPQQADLRAMIAAWREANPELKSFSFAFVRFGDFADLKADSSLAKATRSGMFGMKGALAEIDKVRDLAERGMFVATRMPLLTQAYVELVYTQALQKPEVLNLMDNVDQATETLAGVPDLITSERQAVLDRVRVEREAAVEQVFDRLAVERQATIDMIVDTEEPVRGVLSDVNQTVTAANELALSVDTLAARFVPERPPGWQPEPTESLDLEQVRAILADVTGILEQTDGIVRTVDDLMTSQHWEERLPQLLQVVDRVGAEAGELTDRSFLQAVALMVIFFVLLLGYRFVSHRLIGKPGRA